MLLTDKLRAAQREARREVTEGKVYSVELPIVGRVPVPSPRQLAIYTALGGLAALEIIDWPVAVAMGVGSALVSRQLSNLEEREEELAEAIHAEPPAEPPAETTPSTTAAVNKVAASAPAKKVTAPVKKAAAKKTPAKKAPAAKAAPAKRTPPRES
jgi:cation-transporting ATPase I